MLTAIKHGLRNLVNFHGRDARPAFWFFVLFVYLIMIAVAILVMIPLIVQAISDIAREATAAGQSSDPAMAQAQAEALVMQAITGVISNMVMLSVITNLVMVAVFAASFVRRLHDSNLSGFWALIPGGCQIAATVFLPSQMQRMMQVMSEAMASGSQAEMEAKMQAMQSSMGATSALGWIAILAVIVLGIRESTKGPNRFGEAPFVT